MQVKHEETECVDEAKCNAMLPPMFVALYFSFAYNARTHLCVHLRVRHFLQHLECIRTPLTCTLTHTRPLLL
jgi:hypothetical protein